MIDQAHNDLLNMVENIRVNSRHGRHSPHKPLLLLLSIGRHFNGHERLATFGEIEGDLNRLIRRYGLPNSRETAYHPFWRLRNDGLWEIDRPDLVRETSQGTPYISDLRDHQIRGGLVPGFPKAMDEDPDFARRTTLSLLNRYFPPSLHDDVLQAVRLGWAMGSNPSTGTKSIQLARDPRFRREVLSAYQNRCAVCALHVRFDCQPVALEAAHIMWHSEGGPACVSNGIALCVLHHKFFDEGLFTVSTDLVVRVGESVVGDSFDEVLGKFAGLVLRVVPDRPDQRPDPKYLQWHARKVFRG